MPDVFSVQQQVPQEGQVRELPLGRRHGRLVDRGGLVARHPLCGRLDQDGQVVAFGSDHAFEIGEVVREPVDREQRLGAAPLPALAEDPSGLPAKPGLGHPDQTFGAV
jgi:hypothetical protein